MADKVLSQSDFSAGITRSRKAPANSLYDALDCLINDEGLPVARGGSSLYADPGALVPHRVLACQLVSGQRVVTWDGTDLIAFDTTTPVTVTNNGPGVRDLPVAVAGQLAWSTRLYAGSVKANYSTGTAASTSGSKTITGVGSTWSGNVDKGMYLTIGATYIGIVFSVDSNTQITLVDEAPSTVAAGAYTLNRTRTVAWPNSAKPMCAVGSPERLVLASAERAYFSEPGDPANVPADQYWALAPNALIRAGAAIRDTAALFTDYGAWTISGMNLDPLDPLGNPQHTVQQINKEVTVWDPGGIAGWNGALVVPTEDDVVLLTLDGQVQPISGPVRALYRAYSKNRDTYACAGTVIRGHYLLSICEQDAAPASDLLLVCRLDRGFAWTQWSNVAIDFTVMRTTGGTVTLLGTDSFNIIDCTDCLDPGATAVTIKTNDFDTGPGRPSHVQHVRLVYEAPTGADVDVSWAAGAEDAAYTAATLIRGGADSDGTGYSVWAVNKARDRIRLQITQSASKEFLLREVQLLVRQAGRT